MFLDVHAEINGHLIDPYFYKVGWHLHFEGQSIQWLHKLSATPWHKEFPLLKAGLLEYFKKITSQLLLISLIVKRQVNTEKLQDSIHNEPFGPFLLDETLASYMVPVLFILAAFLHAKPNEPYKLTSTPALKGCIKDLHTATG